MEKEQHQTQAEKSDENFEKIQILTKKIEELKSQLEDPNLRSDRGMANYLCNLADQTFELEMELQNLQSKRKEDQQRI